MTIRLKLALPMVLLFAALTGALHFGWAPVQLAQAREDFIAQQRSELTALKESLARYLLSGDLAALHATLDQQLRLRRQRWRDLVVYDGDGMRVYPLVYHESRPPGPEGRQLREPIELRGSHLGEVVLTIDWSGHKAAIEKRIHGLEWLFALLFALALGFSLLWQDRLVRKPLARLERAVRQLEQGAPSPELPPASGDEIGRLSRAFATLLDTLRQSRQAQQEALEKARESETRLRVLFHTVGDGLLLIDREGTITLCNPAAQAIFGPAGDTLVGRSVTSLIPALEAAALPRAAERGPHETEGLRNGGTTFPLYLHLSEMVLSGRGHYSAVVRDISAQKAAERELLEARRKAEQASRAKSAFLATMSHEIRTPLNGVLGVVQLLEQTPLTQEQREYLEIVDRSGETLLTIINGILDLSRIESGKMNLDPRPFNLRQSVEALVATFENEARAKGLELRLELDEALPPQVVGDEARIKQILFNLVGNAIKFTQRGHVTVRVAAPAPGRIELTVEDSGIGIAEEALPRLFDPFTQAEETTTRRYGGSGLGLTICKHFVELMKGEIEVESRPGQGSRFRVQLPLPASHGQAPPSRPATEALPRFRGRVLVVDDVAQNRTLIIDMLRRMGLEVESAEQGLEAIEKWRKGDYDLILMDCQMPVMDGYQAAAQITALARQGEGRACPIVGFTAAALTQQQHRCHQSGMAGVLLKPIEREALVEMLSLHLERLS